MTNFCHPPHILWCIPR